MRSDLEPNKRRKQLSTHSQSFIHKLFRRLKGPQYQAQVGAEFIIEIHGKVKAGESHIIMVFAFLRKKKKPVS